MGKTFSELLAAKRRVKELEQRVKELEQEVSALKEQQTHIGGNHGGELPSPRVKIEPQEIGYDSNTEILTVSNVKSPLWITTVKSSNSMEPLVDIGHIVVLSQDPKYLDDLNVGDIIIWERSDGESIIHSIIEISQDGDGWYCITKGLNNPTPDNERIRKDKVKWVALLVVWCKDNQTEYSLQYNT